MVGYLTDLRSCLMYMKPIIRANARDLRILNSFTIVDNRTGGRIRLRMESISFSDGFHGETANKNAALTTISPAIRRYAASLPAPNGWQSAILATLLPLVPILIPASEDELDCFSGCC